GNQSWCSNPFQVTPILRLRDKRGLTIKLINSGVGDSNRQSRSSKIVTQTGSNIVRGSNMSNRE
ncbi:hypothetical protein C0J52_02980, partial [Blattella germanica]